MRIASSEFADDPCSSVKRGTMVRAARALLSAVTRLLILADMADVMRLLSHLKIVRIIFRKLFPQMETFLHQEENRAEPQEANFPPCVFLLPGPWKRVQRPLGSEEGPLTFLTCLLIFKYYPVIKIFFFLSFQVEEALEAVKNATNEQDLANRFKEFGKEMVKLNYVAARRQQELKDPHCRDEMAAARGALKKNATMLYTASQAFLRHPDVAATRANRDYVFKQVQEAIAGISNAAQATSPTDEAKGHTGIGELAAALNEFDGRLTTGVITFGIREADVMGSLSVVASELRCVWVKTALSSSC
ncbi:Catenin alpha-2 [Camelus dromedarius]|uniref:Catenin alpha-2 n=1 Tax=Camelus dromedarius TaxID=9838 RepID=A0A5N4CCX6_CAMDR|nr:Catenin alpha-2 [Camelus dromedarius]